MLRLVLPLAWLGVCAVAWSQPIPLQNADFTQVTPEGQPVSWTLSTWYNCRVPVVTVPQGQAPPHVRLDFPADAEVYTVALHQTLPDLPRRSTARIRFQYRAVFAAARRLSVAISGGAGCSLPCNRSWYSATADNQWHDVEITMPLRRVNQTGSVLEFTFNGPFSKGDQFALAKASLTADPPPALNVGFTDPPSGVLFTDAPEQALRLLATPGPQVVGQKVHIRLSGADPGKALHTEAFEAQSRPIAVVLDLARQPVGRYRVVATLINAAGQETARQELTAWRLAPTASTTRVVNGRVVRGSKPLVLLGTYHVCDFAVEAVNRENTRLGLPLLSRDTMLADMTRSGLQAGFYSWGIPPQEYLDAAARHGQLVIPECAGLGREWGGKPLEEQIAPLADDKRIFAWGGSDEPSETTLDNAVAVYQGLKRASPHKLVVNTFCQPDVVDLLEGQALPADLLLVDIYDVREANADLSRVGEGVAHVAEYARKHPGIAVGVTPQAFIYYGPEPTVDQLRVQIYLGLVNGATAFFPYAYVEDYGDNPFAGHDSQPEGMSGNPRRQRWWLPDSAMWPMMPRLRRELDTLSPVILRGTPVAVTTDGGPVQWRATRADGQLYLIAANPQAQTNAAVFHFPATVTRLDPLFGTSPASPDKDVVGLAFGPYEVKVFKAFTAP